ncbi:MAG: family 16 glycosylhydrolase [Saprospiraceae bacterium]|nr:family 16 glycosylhydrolase [Saprospiraceae bacterium]
MKYIYIIIFIFSLYTTTYSQELITNGDFESTATGAVQLPWDGYNNQVLIDDISSSKVGNINNQAGSLFQIINVTPGTTYNLAFDYRWVSGATSYNMTVNVKDGATGGSNIGSGLVLNTTPDTWHSGEYTFTVPAGITQVRTIFWKGDGNRPFRLDNVSVLEDGYVPPLNLIDPDTPVDQQPQGNVSGDWEIEFSDEFNGSASPTPNTDRWIESVSTSSRAPRPFQGVDDWWWRADHVSVNGVGQLELKASKFDFNTMYCGSVETKNLYEPQYGYFEARIEIANTQKGNHTAFWMQGHNIGNVDDSAADGAEVDIFESAWITNTTKAVVHYDGYGVDHMAYTIPYNTPNIHSGYHTYGLHWTETFMEIYYDGVKVFSTNGNKPFPFTTDPNNGNPLVPNVSEWLWLSVGASFGDGTFNLQPIGDLSVAKVDWVRAYKPAAPLAVNDNIIEDAFNIYPNPANHFVNIKSQEDNYSLTVYDMNGRRLFNSQHSKSTKVNVSNFENGLYIFKITSNKAIKTYKVLVK